VLAIFTILNGQFNQKKRKTFTHSSCQSDMYDFLSSMEYKDILKRVGNLNDLVPINFHYIFDHTKEVNGHRYTE